MTKDTAERISECTKLQHLGIEDSNDGLLYDDIKCFLKLTRLKYFAMRGCSVSIANNLRVFFQSGSFSQLVHLDLSSSYFITDITVMTVCENFPQLLHLKVSNCNHLQNEGLQYIGKCIHYKVWMYLHALQIVVWNMLVLAVTI
jgi:hypothetical protein